MKAFWCNETSYPARTLEKNSQLRDESSILFQNPVHVFLVFRVFSGRTTGSFFHLSHGPRFCRPWINRAGRLHTTNRVSNQTPSQIRRLDLDIIWNRTRCTIPSKTLVFFDATTSFMMVEKGYSRRISSDFQDDVQQFLEPERKRKGSARDLSHWASGKSWIASTATRSLQTCIGVPSTQ